MVVQRRFKLAYLLIVSLTACVTGCGLLGPDPNGPGSFAAVSKAAKSAEDRLTSSGAKLEQKTYPLGSGWVVDLSGKEVGDNTFESLKGLGYVAELNLSGSNVSDVHMKHLTADGSGGVLINLDLSNTAISDAGLQQLKDSLYLMSLNLSGTKVTDAGVSAWQTGRAADSRVQANFKKVKITR